MNLDQDQMRARARELFLQGLGPARVAKALNAEFGVNLQEARKVMPPYIPYRTAEGIDIHVPEPLIDRLPPGLPVNKVRQLVYDLTHHTN